MLLCSFWPVCELGLCLRVEKFNALEMWFCKIGAKSSLTFSFPLSACSFFKSCEEPTSRTDAVLNWLEIKPEMLAERVMLTSVVVQFSSVDVLLAEQVLVSFPKLSFLLRWWCGIPHCPSGALCEMLENFDIFFCTLKRNF